MNEEDSERDRATQVLKMSSDVLREEEEEEYICVGLTCVGV